MKLSSSQVPKCSSIYGLENIEMRVHRAEQSRACSCDLFHQCFEMMLCREADMTLDWTHLVFLVSVADGLVCVLEELVGLVEPLHELIVVVLLVLRVSLRCLHLPRELKQRAGQSVSWGRVHIVLKHREQSCWTTFHEGILSKSGSDNENLARKSDSS